jgi:type IV secretory pathway VirB4 component
MIILFMSDQRYNPIHKRLADHKKPANNEKHKANNTLLYQKMRETYINDWYIELNEDFPTERKEQLKEREKEILLEK